MGEHTIDLQLLSRSQGAHLLNIYIGGELVRQKDLDFR